MLDRPQGIEPELVGKHRQPYLFVVNLIVADLGAVAPALKHHLDADVHGALLRLFRALGV